MSRRFRAAIAALAAVAVLSSGTAFAGPDRRRAVAVLEFRSGSAALPGVGARVAALLARKTSLEVIGPDAARVRYGDSLSAVVVRCAAEPDCLSRVGKRIDADEILLIGVSEFGDVILTFQRIGVNERGVAARVAVALPPGAAPDDGALLAYARRVMPASDFLRFGVIRVRSGVTGASVSVAGTPRGVTPVDPIRVRAPASYPIRVAKEGYLDFEAEVAVPPDAEVDVRAELARRRDDPWYQNWWVAAIAGTAVAGAITAGIVLTRDESDVPVTIQPF